MHRVGRPRQAHRSTPFVALLAFTALAASGCAHQRGGVFQNAGGRAGCQVHQTAGPGRAYTDGVNSDTEAILAMMSYLTAHGTQPYCDSRPPSATDRDWAALYIRLGGAATLVGAITGAADKVKPLR
jgi:hypothetical protein